MIDLRFVPLEKWPGEPTKSRKNAAFRTPYIKTLGLLETELRAIDARGIVVEAFYTHDQIRNDGWPRANQNPSHPGVILGLTKPDGPIFVRDGKRMRNTIALSFPCDTYYHIEHNIHAIALSLAALRAVDRYGVTKRAEQYVGWKRIEAPPVAGFASKEEAAAFLKTYSPGYRGYDLVGDEDLRQNAYRDAAKRLHPDSPTGNHELFVRLQQALAVLERP